MIDNILSLKLPPGFPQSQLIQWQQKIILKLPEIKKITAQLSLAILMGFLFNWLHIPVGWLIGAMAVGIAYAIIGGSYQPLPATFNLVGQAIIALTTATGFSLDTLVMAKMYVLPLLLYILITGGISLFNGYLLCRFSGLDMATSVVGCIPGASPSIVAMSHEMGADAVATAVLQYIRVLLVSLIVPMVASLFFSIDSPPISVAVIATNRHFSMPILLELLILWGCGVLGNWGGRKLKLPSSMFLGPFIVGLMAVWLLPYPLKIHPSIFAIGLSFIGLSIGLKFDWQTVYNLRKAVLIYFFLVMVLIPICIGVGYEFHLMTQIDSLTAVLGSSPGGISAIMASVIQLGGDSGMVLTMQMSRMLMILLMSPWISKLVPVKEV